TSLVSSDADPSDNETDNQDQESAVGPERGSDPPDTGQPDTGEPATANPSWPYKKELNTDSEITESPNGARAFADVKALWPADNVLSDVAAASAYAGLPETEQRACFEGIKPYLAECRDVN